MDIEISIWNVPSEQFPSQYGFVTFHDWCVAEAKRIGNGAFIKQTETLVCLCRPAAVGLIPRVEKCPQCGADTIQPRDGKDYCEECGWPEENRPAKSGN